VSVEQQLITEVVLTEAYPYDTAEYSSVQTEKIKKSKPTFNVGADVMWMFNRSIGVGGIVRFSRASVDLTAPGNRTVPVDAGGVYAGGGVRLLF
jgi:hypothetical protein